METIHVTVDELAEHTASEHSSSGPAPNSLTSGPISSGHVYSSITNAPHVPPTSDELKKLFDPMYDEYFEPQQTTESEPPANPPDDAANNELQSTNGPSISITLSQNAPSASVTQPLRLLMWKVLAAHMK